ncbi:nucleoside-diphosphate kinase [Chlamydia abortus]|uniref:Nucleoside diphosphate kinase n=1 Tax=Chlamydia abortus (strain DSM 27085 / S26/3) TaxID=218497 RepID=NDK_CHLAB|nr:nucleoside-diphosphate kinase [Chlamydia abortus]Q5L6Z2.1 RecName: Full=Nucleoside diphosphate kinase; Short=NDK; Short=NDP kinase; AltName: Full=Nucleoside-2-P kinase [Chlamydia abortus S26/3]ASD30308.1 nucleoside-diphosphate kinase [Chlamydia abortus]AUS59550.1 nucleoside diphosphate kinase [Chlamydia abortus]EGK68900.1 putative nucleoside diphosphate kinase [Chlamydia abortus LLG]QEM73504.1 nucleoside-diphosphate kinase [Chlamydia abortus]QRR31835.1 nucleoside-diphosphate kinase [Chlamy
MEQTLSIIKPDSVGKAHIGEIIAIFEKSGFRIAAMKMLHLSVKEAEGFYAVHKSRPFFQELVDFMISGPVVVMVLEGNNAVARNREIMGATNPQEAAPGTIRAQFGESIGINAVHGSDSLENAAIEINYFFSKVEIVNSAA